MSTLKRSYAAVPVATLILIPLALIACARRGGTSTEPGGTLQAAVAANAASTAYAWELFHFLNRQGAPGLAGAVDPAHIDLSTYDDDRDVVWESWANGLDEYEVFPTSCEPMAWSELPRPANGVNRLESFQFESDQRSPCAANLLVSGIHADSHAPGKRVIEVRFNEAAYEYMRVERLCRRECLAALFAEAKTCTPIQGIDKIRFPQQAKVIKASWDTLNSTHDKSRFHWRHYDGPAGKRRYVLTALHVVTRDAVTWYFTSFIHRDYDRHHLGTPDPSPPGSGRPNKWSNYLLIGAQSSFVNAQGVPTVLWNSKIEAGRSSCITCHAAARVDYRGKGSPVVLPLLGTPYPSTFWKPGESPADQDLELIALPTDFIWSLAKGARQCVTCDSPTALP